MITMSLNCLARDRSSKHIVQTLFVLHEGGWHRLLNEVALVGEIRLSFLAQAIVFCVDPSEITDLLFCGNGVPLSPSDLHGLRTEHIISRTS